MNIQPQIIQFYKRYKIEFFALVVAVIIAVSTALFFNLNAESARTSNGVFQNPVEIVSPTSSAQDRTLVVDVSGAVSQPGIYEITPSTRLLTVVEMAGGMTDQADTAYFYRNFNLARPLQDGEKIYIPFQSEIQSGIFVEAPRILRYLSSSAPQDQTSIPAESRSSISSPVQSEPPASGSKQVSVNTASNTELDSLPGVGPKTVEKIVQNRPYNSLEELVQKKVLGQKLYESLKPQLSL
jgi:competence protein ComEA